MLMDPVQADVPNFGSNFPECYYKTLRTIIDIH